ncbi:MAG: family 78 glycoside hydrolase catalytic domain, partial [Planctomycetota bacterium]|nr:family 78 glycoside hydrolase catalytic domain [Planctomycetota bacterium]
DYFTPGWTDYKKRVYYNTYDVTDLVKAGGENAIGAELSAGWYAGAVGWQKHGDIYGKLCKLFVQLEIEMADGTVKTVCSDESWKYAYGPLVEGEFLPGETYDARLETPGWSKPAFDDSAWKPVVATKKIDAKLEGYMSQAVRVTGTLKTKKITQPAPGKFVFDLGQNFAGFVRLKVKGPAGTRVSMRFAEILNPDGTLYTTNLRGARCIDSYVLKGGGKEEVWQPQFTFHGFRYVEISGYPGTPTADAVTGIVLNSDTPLVGSFACSSPMVNQLYSNIVWTQRANFIEIPTDCPQRDERLGWTGDAQVFIRAAAYNADVGAFFTKWLIDVEDAQRPDGSFTDIVPFIGCGSGTAGWADAGTICPWAIYNVYNDHRVLRDRYQSMVRFIDYYKKHSKGLIRPAKGYGDWLSIKADTPKDVMGTAYFARSTKLTADTARVLGKTDDAKKYDALFEEIKAAFNKAFVAKDGRIKGNTQTVYVLAIWFGLLSEEHEKAAARYLVEDIKSRGNHLSTGFNGTAYLMPTLAKTGNNQTAYKLLLNDTFPSWGYSIKHGATSIWERWDGWTADKGFQDPGMNSFAHYSFGAVAGWMFQSIAGIGTDAPGFQRLLIAPCPGPGLTWVKAGYGSIHGHIQSDWKTENGKLTMDVTIPANTTATVVVPCGNPQKITEGGRPVTDSKGIELVAATGGEVVLKVAAGKYSFAAPWKK